MCLRGFIALLIELLAMENRNGSGQSQQDTPYLASPVRWGGQVGNIGLTNTCPLDYFLMSFWAIGNNFSSVNLAWETDTSIFSSHLSAAYIVSPRG